MYECRRWTGSGVLACLAARRARKVYAIEHSTLIDRATLLAQSNGITNVEFLRVHSRDFAPPEKVDVLLHEQIGMNLVDEDMIANLGDLRRRVLTPGGLILRGASNSESCRCPSSPKRASRSCTNSECTGRDAVPSRSRE